MGLRGTDSHNRPAGDEDGDVPPGVANDSLHCVVRTWADSLGSFRACWSCGVVALSCPPGCHCTWYGRPTWGMVENLLGARPPLRGGWKNEYAAIKTTWLRDRVRQTPADGPLDVLRQYARCYILLMIGC
ncbi:hypothetical protein PIB30_049448 [Stylosanthes scabra]|uniref:Uncharacterized protein n=1 Tax=Stylosanthes scabra TaxID=79078 RepID=A0ABU6VKA4_9FABA|nr:hypothetical protein [Stylosanthes scabra]